MGRATFSVSDLSVGNHTITATFTGTTGWLASAGTAATQVVAKDSTITSLTSSANPAAVNQPITFHSHCSCQFCPVPAFRQAR